MESVTCDAIGGRAFLGAVGSCRRSRVATAQCDERDEYQKCSHVLYQREVFTAPCVTVRKGLENLILLKNLRATRAQIVSDTEAQAGIFAYREKIKWGTYKFPKNRQSD